jgi:hypothetical protein
MKTYLLLLFISLSSYSQNGFNLKFEVINPNHAGKIFHNPTSETNKILGSPYSERKFLYAEVEGVANKYFMRYNAYDDSFEFITFENDTLALNKTDDFSSIKFTKTHKKYCFVNYLSEGGKRIKGYLVELHNKADLALYKRESITYYAGKKAKTTLESDLPAQYSKVSYSYYFKTKSGNIIKFPESKKQLTKLFPDKKEAIETFIKENKIDFDADADCIKIIDFLAQ